MFARLFLVFALLSTVAIASAQGISMDVQPAFEGFTPMNGTAALVVDLRNEGGDAQGAVQVTGQSFQTNYPVELPSGSRKLLFVYPSISYGDVQFVLDTNRGRRVFTYRPESNYGNARQNYLMIGDTSGDMAFLKPKGNEQNNYNAVTAADIYGKPGEVPDRAVGYAGINAVVLGSGAERMTDDEVRALKLWTLTGGTLVFIGGASSPILADVRWQDALPANRFHSVNLNGSRVMEKLGDAPVGEITVTSGTSIATAETRMQGNTLITARRSFGVGSVIYLAFNPFEAPLNGWPGRSTAFKKVVRATSLEASRRFVGRFSAENDNNDSFGGPTRSSSVASDPFSATLPPTSQIFMVLAIYFVVVVPVNFLVLKKLGRGEWAWYTAPLISLAFAGVLFSRAQSLYSAKMSTASEGIVVVQQGFDGGMFIGKSQLFIPRGGLYDLKFDGVDSLGVLSTDEDYYSPMGRSETIEFDPVDNGQILVPSMRANNLAFKEIAYRQRIETAGWFDIKKTEGGFIVMNTSPYDLTGAQLVVGDARLKAGDIASGSRTMVSLKSKVGAYEAGLEEVLVPKTVAMVGSLKGFRPGPQIGTDVTQRSNVRVAFVSEVKA